MSDNKIFESLEEMRKRILELEGLRPITEEEIDKICGGESDQE